MILLLPRGRGRNGQWIVAFLSTAALAAFLFLLSCADRTPPNTTAVNNPAPPAPAPEPSPAPLPTAGCPPAIAQPDLSGACRATPQATMGALEAVS